MAVVTFRSDQRISVDNRRELRMFISAAGQSIKGLASRLGLIVVEERLPKDTAAVLLYSPRCGSASGYKIVVNQDDPPERQRFSVAHEIGHFVLHRGDPDFKVLHDDENYGEIVPLFPVVGNSFRNGAKSRVEREANQFAAALLMPANLVRANVNYRLESVQNLAREFYVSFDAMDQRVRELKESDRMQTDSDCAGSQFRKNSCPTRKTTAQRHLHEVQHLWRHVGV